MTQPANVELHIEELVLHGFAPGDRAGVGAAVERELTRLFAEGSVPPSLVAGGAWRQLDGGSFTVAPGSGAERIGVQVAQAVYRGLDQ